MIVRNLETRIMKLELSRRRPNEFLLVWRRPNGDVSAAASEAKFAPGDRVICLEWFGDGPLPAPRWYGKRSEISVIEKEYLDRCLTGARTRGEEGVCQRDPGFADFPHVPAERIGKLHDNDLLHMLFGVAT
jgi:hypothetical protein